MPSIAEQLKALHETERKLLRQQDKIRANKTFKCSCGQLHRIKECDVIQTHQYEAPYSCTGGGDWFHGELQILCPDGKGVRNRVMFSVWDIPYELRKELEHNPQQQFKNMYKGLFKKVVDEYDRGDDNYKFFNNDYFDEHRSKFELCEKVKKEKTK